MNGAVDLQYVLYQWARGVRSRALKPIYILPPQAEDEVGGLLLRVFRFFLVTIRTRQETRVLQFSNLHHHLTISPASSVLAFLASLNYLSLLRNITQKS